MIDMGSYVGILDPIVVSATTLKRLKYAKWPWVFATIVLGIALLVVSAGPRYSTGTKALALQLADEAQHIKRKQPEAAIVLFVLGGSLGKKVLRGETVDLDALVSMCMAIIDKDGATDSKGKRPQTAQKPKRNFRRSI